MTIFEIDPLRDPRWTMLVEAHPRASVFHSTKWLEALHRTYEYQPIVVTTCGPNTVLTNGLVFCRIASWLTGRRLVSLPFSDHCEALVSNPDELDILVEHLQSKVDGGPWKYVEIRPKHVAPSSDSRLGQCNAYYFHKLKLQKSEEQLFRSFHKDCVQRKIRRAEREHLEYVEGRSDPLLRDFYRLLVMTRRRQYLPPQPLAWFRQLILAFEHDLKIRVASKNGRPVASILTITHQKTVTYKYGCSDARFNKLGGMALLFWKTIQEAKEKGFEELDMGRSDIYNPGLVAFKEHWGATPSKLNYWKYPNNVGPSYRGWKARIARVLVTAAPDLSLVTAGTLLYRHIG